MKKKLCPSCNYMFEPVMLDGDEGFIAFEDLPEDWKCPSCGAEKAKFVDKEA